MDEFGDINLRKRLDLAKCIAHWMADTATEEEKQLIDRWLDEKPDNRNKMEKFCKRAMEDGKVVCPDLERRWRNFEKRVGYRRVGWKRYGWVAAILVLPICITFYLYNQLNKEIVPVIPVAEEVIVPGMNKALLIMADGKTVNLENATDGSLQEQNGVRILMSGEQLQYKADSVKKDIPVYNTLVVPVGGEYSIVLSDGSQVWLNAGSKLRYPVVFADSLRQVELMGEGYFEVCKSAGKPFVVKVADAEVKVLGTSFNVSAYENVLTTTLVEGKVVVAKEGEQVMLQPNQQACWSDEKQRFAVRKVEVRNYVLWKEGIFWFSDVDLETILKQLSRWYDLDIKFVHESLKSMRFSLELKRYHDIDDVLRKIAYTKKVKFAIEGRTLKVMKQ